MLIIKNRSHPQTKTKRKHHAGLTSSCLSVIDTRDTPELTRLALNSQPKNSNKTPHETVEDFFLYNDSTTVATELPVFINPEEFHSSYSQNGDSARPNESSLDLNEPITGHIDLIQIRYDNLYILDYKPNLNKPERHASQLQLYKKAINKRTSIPEDQIKTAVFNQYKYYEFQT